MNKRFGKESGERIEHRVVEKFFRTDGLITNQEMRHFVLMDTKKELDLKYEL